MKKLLIAASFALAMPAGALANSYQQESASQYCGALGRYAAYAAIQRDAGVSPNGAVNAINEAIANEGRPVEEWRLYNMHEVLDRIYTAPHQEPLQEGIEVYSVCLQEYQP